MTTTTNEAGPIRWYKTPVDKQAFRALLEKKDGPGLFIVGVTLALLINFGYLAYATLGTWWSYLFFFIYGSIYVLSGMAAMHETHHRTAFKTPWLNETVNWISGFMLHKEARYDRWRHLQHHAYTLYEEQDPEFFTARPPVSPWLLPLAMAVYYPRELIIPFVHATGKRPAYIDERINDKQWQDIVWSSRLFVLGVVALVSWSILAQSWLPLVYTIFAPYYGGFLATLVQTTQHTALAVNNPDHRTSTRTTYMNPLLQFFYWNMNYHTEHHMYAAVPFHALPKLHLLVKHDYPEPSDGFVNTLKEILPAAQRVRKAPQDFIRVQLPEQS
ncbi:fatty acid desaturase [Microbulbifer sp. YPW1]|uniref:fatty acid desaturase n=1 Tax=Microbulbifer sp. YPW1 TaxID=2745199 RepID=UPI0015993AAF|nr:fatty acid desaturase [Microbulbifer sp. YPW1]QKX17211.1 fatty acid desaturase [Microbulbifer sp. YPW1]